MTCNILRGHPLLLRLFKVPQLRHCVTRRLESERAPCHARTFEALCPDVLTYHQFAGFDPCVNPSTDDT